jgi:hypothetical protein
MSNKFDIFFELPNIFQLEGYRKLIQVDRKGGKQAKNGGKHNASLRLSQIY